MFRLTPERTIIASALAAGTVFSGFLIKSLGNPSSTKSDSV